MNLIKKWQEHRQRQVDKKLQREHKEYGIPAYRVDHNGDVLPARLKTCGNHMIISKIVGWIEVNPDGTVPPGSYVKRWFYAGQDESYNPDKIVKSILKTRTILPLLMGIDLDLDRLIEKELKRDV